MQKGIKTGVVAFTTPDSEKTKITLTFKYDRDNQTLEWEQTEFEKESDEDLDFIGFLANTLLMSLRQQGDANKSE